MAVAVSGLSTYAQARDCLTVPQTSTEAVGPAAWANGLQETNCRSNAECRLRSEASRTSRFRPWLPLALGRRQTLGDNKRLDC